MIRKFDIKDIDDVMNIWITENIKTHSFIPNEYWKNNFEYVKNILPNAEIYVYVEDNIILGFIGLNDNYIEGIFVDSNYQDKGIGTALLNKAKEIKQQLTLNVYKKNSKAIKFYQKNGFEITEENIDEENDEVEYIMLWKYN